MRLREATPADAPLIHALICELAAYERLLHEVVSTPDHLAADLAPTAAPRLHALLAEVDGHAVGFALYFPIYSTFRGAWGMYLEDLYVRPEARGRGVGLALLRRVAQDTLARGGQRLDWQVLTWNQLALAFYERIGAKPLDDWQTRRLSGDALHALAASDVQPQADE